MVPAAVHEVTSDRHHTVNFLREQKQNTIVKKVKKVKKVRRVKVQSEKVSPEGGPILPNRLVAKKEVHLTQKKPPPRRRSVDRSATVCRPGGRGGPRRWTPAADPGSTAGGQTVHRTNIRV